LTNRSRNRKRIFFLYPSVDKSRGGAAVHGYNLINGLANLGFGIFLLKNANGTKKPLAESLYRIFRSHVIYYRIYLTNRSIILLFLLSKFKKVVVELNAPSDELLLKGFDMHFVNQVDNRLRFALKNVKHIVTVSDAVTQYCQLILKFKNVTTVNNGGELLNPNLDEISSAFKESIVNLKNKFNKIVLWSGTNYPWQGYQHLRNLIFHHQSANFAFIIVSDDKDVLEDLGTLTNVQIYTKLNRNEVAYLMCHADVGCALYGDFSVTRTGFYNSSLKFHEYLVNRLGVIASPYEYFFKYENENVTCTHDIDRMVDFIKKFTYVECGNQRTWEDVSRETAQILNTV
jgi:hypothetical protein